MTVIHIRNTSAEAEAPPVPQKDDGSPFAFELTHHGGSWRTYADAPSDLVDALIPGYAELATPRDRARARISLALKLQVQVQAAIVASPDFDLVGCTEEQRALLLSSREVPPTPRRWDAPVPLVLVTTYYRPAGRIAPPEGPADAVWWIDPGDDWRLLESLHRLGVIGVHLRSDLLPPSSGREG